MKSWKTSLASTVAACGLAMQASDDENVKLIGQVLSIIGTFLIGFFSKDNNVTGGTRQQ